MKKITIHYLINHGACGEKVWLFKEVFGNSCDVNIENAKIWRKHSKRDTRDDFLWLLGITVMRDAFSFSKYKKLLEYILPDSECRPLWIDAAVLLRRYRWERLFNAVVQIMRVA